MHRFRRVFLFVAPAVIFAAMTAQGGPKRYEPFRLDREFLPPLSAIDSHLHLAPGTADSVVAHMDEWGIGRMVVLAIPNFPLEEYVDDFLRYPDRFAVLAYIDFSGIDEPGWEENLARQVRRAKERGFAGIKLYKDSSVYLRDKGGKLIPVDDPRFDPLWKTAGELGMPILIHVGDPERFWMPPSEANTIEEESWAFYGTGVPFREELLRELEHVFAKHPGTTFVGAHFGNRSEEPLVMAYLLDKYPNVYIDTAARYGELSKRARETRWVLMEYSDRILFGTDWGIWSPDGFEEGWAEWSKVFYSRAHRILWTRDAKIPTPFDGNEGTILVGEKRWAVDGWEIPGDVLRKICVENAERIWFHR